MRAQGTLWIVVVLLALCASVGMTCSAEDLAQIRQAVDRLQDQVIVLQEQKEDIDAVIAALPEGDVREQAEAARDALLPKLEQAQASLTVLQDRLANATDALDVVEAGAEVAKDVIPPPYGAAIGGIVGLAVGLFRAWRNKETAKQVIRSVDGVVKPTDMEAKVIRERQGASGNALVDAAQGKKAGLNAALPF